MIDREEEKTNRINALRARAEKQLRTEIKGINTNAPTIQDLLHELHVRQVELEMQNEELMDSRAVIEKSMHDYATLYEYAPIAYFTIDRYGVIMKANVAATRLVGHTNKMLMKQSFRNLLVASQASAFYTYINTVLKTDTKHTATFDLLTSQEKVRHVHIEAQSLYEQGAPAKCLLAVIDVTAQKEAETKLEREKAFTESLLENSIDGIVAFDTETRIVSWNKVTESLTGKYKTEVMGRKLVDLFPAYQINEEGKAIRKALQGEASIINDHPFGLHNGFYEVYTVPLFEQEPFTGNPIVTGGLCIIHDVTERIKMEQERISLKMKAQKELLNAIMQAQEEERKRIAESLHNGVGQILYAAQLNLQQMSFSQIPLSVEEFTNTKNRVESLLKEAIRDLRRASHELVPILLEQFGLSEAIHNFCSRFSHTNISFSCYGFEQPLEKPLELAFYRIAQELINNIIKHSGATRARLELFKEGSQLVLEAQDNGKGFEEGALEKKGIGIKSIQDRVKLLGGTMEIESSPSKGSLLTIIVPLI